jgi:hypothetical protein
VEINVASMEEAGAELSAEDVAFVRDARARVAKLKAAC